jgi:hypothetical protein
MSHRGKRLRPIAEAFVIAAPGGARVRTRLVVDDADRSVLEAVGVHLGALASSDLARRVAEGSLGAKAKAESRAARKRGLTAGSSSRWAGAITRTTEDAYGLAKRNLQAERVSLGLLLFPGVDLRPSSQFDRSDLTMIRALPVLGKRRFRVASLTASGHARSWSQGTAAGRARTGAQRRLAVCP